jgi:redox-sensitive bicupin YhaK (pirin superfamily)
MVEIRRAEDRGIAEHGWLSSRHTFSFGHYYDPEHTGFGPLLVINEDRVEPGQGFGTHAHQNMEIITYVLEGTLEHKDSMGVGSVIHYGDVQRMSAGTGVQHSEYNHSRTASVHFLQIWIEPNVNNVAPSYQQTNFDPASKRGQLRLIASAHGKEDSVMIHQDARLYASILEADDQIGYALAPGRRGYVHIARGAVVVNGVPMKTGDGLKLIDEPQVRFEQGADAELLLFDLP